MKEKLITIVGPTASGKTELAVHLAKMLGSSVISGDAFQVYRGMDIGTAKVTKEEMDGVPHFLIDILEPTEEYSAALFQKLAREIISKENEKGRIPILAGGTGLYVQGLLEGFSFAPKTKDRSRWDAVEEEKGMAGLIELFHTLAPEEEPPKDPQRLKRRLELLTSGTDAEISKEKNLVYDGPVIGIRMDRLALYDRINQRVHSMMEHDLEEEVRSLLMSGIPKTAQALKGIGYREMIPVIEGEAGVKEAEELIAQHTRQFAKRQMTWWRHMPYIRWVERNREDDWIRETEAIVSSWTRGD